MTMQPGERLRARAFANACGVTVRTLHLYDRLGLLEPAQRTPSGYRLYGEREYERLEHILALRFVGFSLEQIKELLRGVSPSLSVALRMQREVIARRKRRLESALAAIDEAQRALAADAAADRWSVLRTVIEEFKMQDDVQWTERYYSQAAREKIAALHADTPRETIERGERDWATLIAEVEAAAARGEDPSSEASRALAQRWQSLVAQFTKGDGEIQSGLNQLWSDRTHWPAGFKRPWSDAADAFIHAAMRCDA